MESLKLYLNQSWISSYYKWDDNCKSMGSIYLDTDDNKSEH